MCPTNRPAAAWGRARRREHSSRRGQGTCRRRGLAREWILTDEAFTYLQAESLLVAQRAPQNFFCNISRGSAPVSFAARCTFATVCAKSWHASRLQAGSAAFLLRGFGALERVPIKWNHLIDKDAAQNQKVGACPNRKSRATFSGHALPPLDAPRSGFKTPVAWPP